MRSYPKIDTLFERDAAFKITDVLRRPVFSHISKWVVTEKIDGTNIRASMVFGSDKVEFNGRSDNAQIHADLVRHLYETITPEKFGALFIADTHPGASITLFGEGYGAGIQKGGDYRPDKGFILFDALVECDGAQYWQDDTTVTDFANRLGIPRVPILGQEYSSTWNLSEIVEAVRIGIDSMASVNPRKAEGIVARTVEPLFDRRGNRLILKLKTSDFK